MPSHVRYVMHPDVYARKGVHYEGDSMARRKRSASRAHARHTTALATRPNVVVVRSGGGGGRRRSGGTRTVVVRRAARRIGRGAARHGLPMTGLALGGALVGYAQSSGWFDALPELGGSKMLALGVAGYLATRMTHNKYVREAGAAAVAVAAFEFGREHGGGGGKKGGVHGWGGIGSGGGVGPFGGA